MIFSSRWVEFIFSQTAPAVCLPCRQTDFTKRIIALFRILLYRLFSKILLKIENTGSNQLELEFTFSFDHLIGYSYIFFIQLNTYLCLPLSLHTRFRMQPILFLVPSKNAHNILFPPYCCSHDILLYLHPLQ